MFETRVFCAYCDHRYLPRAQTLVQSLRRHGCTDEVWLYCLTEECHQAAKQLDMDGVRLFTLTDLETTYPQLLKVKPERTILEYYYTISPLILDFAMMKNPAADSVTYLDADLWFFDNPQKVFDAIGEAPVAIIPHNFPPKLKSLERFGVFNVGWVTFRRSAEGIACLEWWRDRCLEWCFGIPEGDRCGDQGYLSRFHEIAPNTKVLRHKGCNTAPWNVENYNFTLREGKIFVDEDPLLFFHFHGVSKAFGSFYFDSHRRYGAPMSRLLRNSGYKPYIAALSRNEKTLKEMMPQLDMTVVNLRGQKFLGVDIKNLRRTAMAKALQTVDLAARRPILALHSRVY